MKPNWLHLLKAYSIIALLMETQEKSKQTKSII